LTILFVSSTLSVAQILVLIDTAVLAMERCKGTITRPHHEITCSPVGLAGDAIFGELGSFAPEEFILQLVESICLPILLYGTEAFCPKKSDMISLDFVVNIFLLLLF
jgi:hypothetical protein